MAGKAKAKGADVRQKKHPVIQESPDVRQEEHSVAQKGPAPYDVGLEQAAVTRHKESVLQPAQITEEKGPGVTQEPCPLLRVPAETLQELLSMLEWWKDTQQEPTCPTVTVRPYFKREPDVTKTIRLSAELVRRAEQKARYQDKARTGGHFSGLCEILLWEYLGCPDDLIEPEPPSQSGGDDAIQ